MKRSNTLTKNKYDITNLIVEEHSIWDTFTFQVAVVVVVPIVNVNDVVVVARAFSTYTNIKIFIKTFFINLSFKYTYYVIQWVFHIKYGQEQMRDQLWLMYQNMHQQY